MAKSKKSDSKAADGAEKAPKKKAAAKKPVAKKAAPSPAAQPLIDTSLAAEAAAKMLVAGFNKASGSPGTPRQESALFKQLKAGLSKPHAAAMSNLLEKSQGPEPAKTHPQFKQVGQNQTFGADVTRSGVPRRTPG